MLCELTAESTGRIAPVARCIVLHLDSPRILWVINNFRDLSLSLRLHLMLRLSHSRETLQDHD